MTKVSFFIYLTISFYTKRQKNSSYKQNSLNVQEMFITAALYIRLKLKSFYYFSRIKICIGVPLKFQFSRILFSKKRL